MSEVVLEVRNLKKYYPVRRGFLFGSTSQVRAVDDISFTLNSGETLGLVGESGCGKSTTGRVILRLQEATEGKILFRGEDILASDEERLRTLRREMQIVFQDPYGSLNPRMRVGSIISEAFTIHESFSAKEKREKTMELLELVGLRPDQYDRYPHEFSGGQRQRIGFARALALRPTLLVCDEPVSALDMSIQAQILNLMKDLQQRLRLTCLFISHNLSVVRHVSSRIAVMYLGRIVEECDGDTLYDNPQHPYTRALLSAIPVPRPRLKRERTILQGDLPSPLDPPLGCTFHPRCPEAGSICREQRPVFRDLGVRHFCACHMR